MVKPKLRLWKKLSGLAAVPLPQSAQVFSQRSRSRKSGFNVTKYSARKCGLFLFRYAILVHSCSSCSVVSFFNHRARRSRRNKMNESDCFPVRDLLFIPVLPVLPVLWSVFLTTEQEEQEGKKMNESGRQFSGSCSFLFFPFCGRFFLTTEQEGTR